MPRFFVTLEETVLYEIEVEAADEDAASALAEEMWAQSENPTEEFGGSGNGVEAINVEQDDDDDDSAAMLANACAANALVQP